MMVIGVIIGLGTLVIEDPVDNQFGAAVGLILLGGGLIYVTLFSARMWRMLIGAGAGAVAAWLGYRFGIDQRLVPVVEDEPTDVFDRVVLAPIALGTAVLTIGLGGLLEALRAQSEPGHSPIAVRVALIVIGAGIAAGICSLAGVSGGLTIAVVAATVLLLAALAWLRRERPPSDFQPSP